MHHEEKPDPSCNVHYWVMPVLDRETGTTSPIMRLDIRRYLSGFRFRDERDAICANNVKMREHFEQTALARRDGDLAARFASHPQEAAGSP
jgi:hypothetical protein